MKQLKKIHKIHRHIANQRLDHLHKKSTEIANQYDVVCVESLNLRAMSNKGFGNGKATLDNGYGMFLCESRQMVSKFPNLPLLWISKSTVKRLENSRMGLSKL